MIRNEDRKYHRFSERIEERDRKKCKKEIERERNTETRKYRKI